MAFKRSAVRSRLSPPSPEIVRFQDFFYITNLQGDVMALNPATASLRRVIAAMPGARGHNDFQAAYLLNGENEKLPKEIMVAFE